MTTDEVPLSKTFNLQLRNSISSVVKQAAEKGISADFLCIKV